MKLTKEQQQTVLAFLRVKAWDFAEQYQPVYEHLKWTWWDTASSPSIEEIVNAIHEKLERVEQQIKHQEYSRVSSGGIEVYVDNTEGLKCGILFEGGVRGYEGANMGSPIKEGG